MPLRLLPVAVAELVQVDSQLEVGAQADQPAAAPRRLGVLAQPLAQLASDPLAGGQRLLQGGEAGQQVGGGLGADSRHPGDVVAAVAGQGQIVGQLLGLDTELPHQVGGVEVAAAEVVPHPDAAGQQLAEDLVGGEHRDRGAGGHRLDGDGGDDVVGLESGEAEGRDADLAERLAVAVERRGQRLGNPLFQSATITLRAAKPEDPRTASASGIGLCPSL